SSGRGCSIGRVAERNAANGRNGRSPGRGFRPTGCESRIRRQGIVSRGALPRRHGRSHRPDPTPARPDRPVAWSIAAMTIAIGSTPIETPANRPTRSGGAGHDGQTDDAPRFDDLIEGSGSRHAKPLAGGPGRKDNAARLGGGNADSPSLSPADGSLDEVLASDQEHGPQKTRADRRERHGDETR